MNHYFYYGFLTAIFAVTIGSCFRADLENAADPSNPDNLSTTAAIAVGIGTGAGEETGEETGGGGTPSSAPNCVFDNPSADPDIVFDTCTWAP